MKNLKKLDLIQLFKVMRRKLLWKLIYNKVYHENNWFLFQTLNYGYAHMDSFEGILSSSNTDYPVYEIYGYQLYSAVLSHETLKSGMDVLEVGCGTGYGLAEHAVTNPEIGFKGLDFSRNSINQAVSTFSNTNNLEFIKGNSMDLPFENNSFDLLFNIESSHCYSDKDKFFAEVHRVLKPGGKFLIADFRMPENYDKFLTNIQQYLRVDKEVDITKNVLKSLQKSTPFRKKKFDEYFNKRPLKAILARNLLERFSGIEGSRTFERFASGYWKYFLCVLKKPSL